ncbi:threonine/serine exporter family protein [Clostridium sp.]|jgi:uncharacterized membrane protein YjjB (DUF3815 family)|uniref:threonine/serine exporter family protein n=1 Tax=Clostridium sp. TaxID=1506 RepID=UPI0039F5A481
MILNSIYALLSSLAFAFLFNIRGKNLIFTSFGGAIGWFTYLLFINYSFSKVFVLFIASISVSVYSEIMARVLKSPVTIFLICGIIPLVPGAGMYYTMYEITMGNVDASLSIGLETISSAGAIAVATVLVASITKVIVILKRAHNV